MNRKQFGHFDDDHHEYVITRPDTPKSWSNYLGSTEFGSIITNNAGGYCFYRSGGMGRFIRMRFNSIPMDQPGRYIYFHDRDSKDYWSASWQPVAKPLEEFQTECRHGTAYTTITSKYRGIESEATFFVPIGKHMELWRIKVKNTGSTRRNLSGFTYQEYACSWNAIDDLLNIQYVQYIATMKMVDGIIDHGTNVNVPAMPEDFKEKDQSRHSFQAVAGAKVVGHDTDREAFLGPYRTYANPIAVEQGKCSGSMGYGDNPCGSLQIELSLEPGEETEFVVIVGVGTAEKEGRKAVADFSDPVVVERELQMVKDHWRKRIEGFSAITPDGELNSTINTWGIYNSLITFAWSRAASLVYSGVDRDGLGYRDTVQDFLGVMHSIQDEARDRLELMITGQVSTGGAMPVVLPLSHHPGQETAPSENEYRSDDAMWLFNAIPAYVKESGDLGFYQKVLPYADKGDDTVFGHMKRAIEFNLDRSGAHGLPCGLHADWNDCLRFGHNGESVFVAMQLRLALSVYSEVAELLNEADERQWSLDCLAELDGNIQKHCWDGEWFMRGYRFDGLKFGSKEEAEGKIFLNPQAWAVISGASTGAQAELCMRKVREKLATEYGILICDPPYTNSDHQIVRAQLMNPGLKENGGIFVHTQAWAVIAEAILGNGDQAYKYLRAYLPAAYNSRAGIREIEPYVVSQSTHTAHSPKHGASRLPWLSGSASWTYYAISQYVLGVQPDYHGIRIDPCVPSEWEEFTVNRTFRGRSLRIKVENPGGAQKGVRKMVLNGAEIPGNFIPISLLELQNEILVVMGSLSSPGVKSNRAQSEPALAGKSAS
jgi:cellobiose phosphorylase